MASIMSKSSVDSFLSNSLFNPASSSTQASLASARKTSTALPPAFNGLDLLILSAPPPSIAQLSPSAPSLSHSLASPAPPLSEVVKRSRPRYMLWADGEGFWEREPFGWVSQGTNKEERWTRSVKLGAFGGVTPEGSKKARVRYNPCCRMSC